MSRAVRRQQAKADRAKPKAAPARAIPSSGPKRAPQAKEAKRSSFLPRWLADIISELRKVVWPTREDVVYLTFVVVVVTIVLGAILGVIDIAFGWLIDELLLGT
jgi:preprotein translocase subunit SecE